MKHLSPKIESSEKNLSSDSPESKPSSTQATDLASLIAKHPDNAKEAVRKILLEDLYLFATVILGYKEMTRTTHGPICELLEDRECKQKLIICPRGSFKSSLCVVAYSIWSLLKDPNLRIMIDSELYTNSKNFIREIKAHLQSETFTYFFGDHVGPLWTEGEIIIKTRTKNLKEPSIQAAGIGTVKVGQHCDIILFDDLNSNQNSATTAGQQKVIDHYKYMLAVLEPQGEVVVTATRYASLDLPGFIIEEAGLNENEL